MSNATPPPAGWYPDPAGEPVTRWWNGLAWTSTTQAPAEPLPIVTYPSAPANGAYGSAAAYPAAPAASPYPGAPAARQQMVPAASVQHYGVVPYGTAQPSAVAPYGAAPRYAQATWRAPRPIVRGMGDAIRVVMNKYGTFDGLASRPEFWYWYLFNGLLGIGAVVGLAIPFVGIAVYLLFIGWLLAVMVPTLAVSVRRLRDAGYHWGFLFLQLVPFGGIALLVLFCQPSRTQ